MVLLGGYTLGCHSLRHLVGGGLRRALASARSAQRAYDCVSCLNRRHMRWAWCSLFSVAFADLYVRLLLDGRLVGLEDPLDGRVRDASSTTCWSSARRRGPARGHRGLGRAACRSGLVCKSLLGKAHTVMAEGGIAAALANVDERDNWKVHFADTMRGGQYVNNWRMAELHAKEAPDRVRELEAWGARLRPHAGRPHPAAQLRRPQVPAPRPRRRPHRPGDDPHAAGPRHPPGHRRPHGVHRRRACSRTATASSARSATTASAAASRCFGAKAVVLATGGIGRAYKITSNSWEYTGDGHALAYDAGAELMDMEFVQFHPTGMVWPPSVQGILVTEGVRGEGGVLLNKDGRRFMFDDIPENYRSQTADNEEEGWRYTQGDKNARRPPELLTRDHVARCIVREVKEGRGSPHGGVFLDISWIKREAARTPRSTSSEAAEHVPPVQAAGATSTSPRSRWRSARRRTTSWAACASSARRRCRRVPGLFAAGECAAGINGANRLGGNSLSDLLVFGKRAGEYAARFAQRARGRARSTRRRWTRRRGAPSSRSSARDGDARARTRSSTTCRR